MAEQHVVAKTPIGASDPSAVNRTIDPKAILSALADVPPEADPRATLKKLNAQRETLGDLLKRVQSRTAASQAELSELKKATSDLDGLSAKYEKSRDGYLAAIQSLNAAAEARLDSKAEKDPEKKKIEQAVDQLFADREADRRALEAKREAWEEAELESKKADFAASRAEAAFDQVKDNYGSIETTINRLTRDRDDITRQRNADQDKLAYLEAYLLKKNSQSAKALVDVTPEDLLTKLNAEWKKAEQAKRDRTAKQAAAEAAKSDLANAKAQAEEKFTAGLKALADANTVQRTTAQPGGRRA